MFTISGKTWDHKDTIKAAGGRWDGDRRVWTVANLSDIALANLRALPGLIVTGEGGETSKSEPKQKPEKLNETKKIFENYKLKTKEEISSYDPHHHHRDHSLNSMGDAETVRFGDDMTYFNAFDYKNPRSFFGFSSLRAFADYVREIPASYRYRFLQAWEGRESWTKTADMDEALSLADNGWAYGAELAEQVREMLVGQNVVSRQRKMSVAGGRVNVGAMLSGNPKHMVRRPKMPSNKRITIFVETLMSAAIKSTDAIKRAAVIAAVIDILEENGYSCEIVATITGGNYQMAIALKQAGDKFNINDIVFALGHPAFTRRLSFASVASDIRLESEWLSQGFCDTAFRNPERGTIYLNRIPYGMETEDGIKALAVQLFRDIFPDDLPITINME